MGLLNVLPYFTSPNIEIGYISQRWIVQLIKHCRCHRIIFFFVDETNILRYIYYYTYYSKAKGAFTLIYGLFCFVLFLSSPGYSAFLRFGWAVFKIEGKIKEDKSEGILNIGILRNPKITSLEILLVTSWSSVLVVSLLQSLANLCVRNPKLVEVFMSQELEPTSPCADVLLLFPVGEVSGDSIRSEQISFGCFCSSCRKKTQRNNYRNSYSKY